MQDKHFEGIDILRGIACLIVVLLHVPFPDPVGKIIGFSLNFSVPVFFMITGFFATSKLSVSYCINKALRMAKIILLTEVLYGLWFYIIGQDITIGINRFIRYPLVVIFSGTIFNGTLWYLYAALWTWIIYALLKRSSLIEQEKVFLLIPVLCVIHIVGRQLFQEYYDISKGIFIFRSVLLFGLPMTLLGTYIARKKDQLLQCFNPIRCILLALCGGGISILEYFLSHLLFNNPGTDFHISTIVVSVALFLLALNYPRVDRLRISKYIGGKLYMWIYLSHIFVASLIEVVGNSLNVAGSNVYMWSKPILTIFGTILFGLIMNCYKTSWRKNIAKG